MKFAIIVDSGCDADRIEIYEPGNVEVGFEKVPLKIEVGTKEFSDGIGFETAEMLETLESYRGKTSTAAPSPGEWLAAFSKYDAVFAITITGGLSGSFAAAEAAKSMALESYPDIKIEILNSLSTSAEMTMIAEKLYEYICAGLSFEEIVPKIHDYMEHTRLLYILESVDNLANNGRVSKLEGKLVRVLDLRLLGRASLEGTLELLQKCRGKMKVAENLVKTMFADGYAGGKVIISHCYNEEMALTIKDKITKQVGKVNIPIMKAKGINSYYAERGGILIGYELAR